MSVMELTDAMLAHTFSIIDKMEVGEKLVIKKYSPNRPDLFINCCKKWIDCYKNGEFNKKYTIFRKTEKIF